MSGTRGKIFEKLLLKQQNIFFHYPHSINVNNIGKRLRMIAFMEDCFKIILSPSLSPSPTYLFEAGGVYLLTLAFRLLKKIRASMTYGREMNR